MATVYKQSWTAYDGRLGAISFEFVVSDDYYELFDQTTVLATGIFNVGNTKEDLDIDVGIQSIDELSFSMSSVHIKNATDLAAFNFTLQGLEQSTPRYVALFINPASNGDINAKVFDGKMKFDGKGTDLKWNDAIWGVAPVPDREWEFTANNIGYSMLDEINVLSILLALSVDDSWKNTNIFAGNTSLDSYKQLNDLVQINELVELPNLIAKIIDIALNNLNFGIKLTYPNFKINLLNSDSSMYFTPGVPTFSNSGIVLNGFDKDENQMTRLRILGTSGTPAWINSYMILPDNNTQKYSFRRYEKLSELLYGIAISFGCYVKFETVSKDEINISFVPRQQLATEQTYILDVESAMLNIEYADKDENLAYYGVANDYAVEGNETCFYNYVPSNPSPNAGTMNTTATKTLYKPEGEQLIFSISPLFYRKTYANPLSIIWNGLLNYDSTHKFYGIITALYMPYVSLTQPYLTYRPCVQASININTEQKAFDKLADCVNAILASDGKYYKKEYELKVPYLLGFSLNSDGSANSWLSVKKGNKVVIDSDEYAIIGIDRDYTNLSTTLRLHKVSQYAFEQPSANLLTIALETININYSFASNVFIGTAGESLDVGVAVYLGSPDQLWHYAYSESINGGLVGGITLTSANLNNSIDIISGGQIGVDGIAGFDNWNWQQGKNECLFVRAKKGFEPANTNISQLELTAKDGTEDFYIKIGYPIEPKKIVLDFSEQWIFED